LFSNFLLNLGFRLDVLFGVPSKRFLASRGSRRAGLVLASDFQRTRSRSHTLFAPSSVPKAGAKVQLFSLRATLFFNYLKLFYILLIIKLLKTNIFSEKHGI
jgi:hypothetical protein